MEDSCMRLGISCLLFAWLGIGSGCGNKGNSNASNGHPEAGDTAVSNHSGGAGGASASGQSGSGKAGTTAGSAGMTQSTGGKSGAVSGSGGSAAGGRQSTPPPEMPRSLGAPDGVYCESDFKPPPETCAAGSRCCPNDEGGEHQQVCTKDAKCPACDGVTCAQLTCDGPEDCSGGQFCCYSEDGFCKNNPDACVPSASAFETSSWISVECKARCVGDQSDPDHGIVVCKDDHDCPGKYKAGRCQDLNTHVIPNGIKVCSGG